MSTVNNRLMVFGSELAVKAFEESNWLSRLRGKHPELYERRKSRAVWWFETETLPPRLGQISADWPDLIFLLEYENETKRLKGLVKADARAIDRCEFSY